jgi:hypothetical protein
MEIVSIEVKMGVLCIKGALIEWMEGTAYTALHVRQIRTSLINP